MTISWETIEHLMVFAISGSEITRTDMETTLQLEEHFTIGDTMFVPLTFRNFMEIYGYFEVFFDGNTRGFIKNKRGVLLQIIRDRFVKGNWHCDASPVGVCVYDDPKDPVWDNCIYCGNPHERK